MRRSASAPGATAPAWRPAPLTRLGAAPAIGGLCWALCAWEARRAQRGPRPYAEALRRDGRIGPPGVNPIRMVWLGDSLACGLGVDTVDETPAHLVAHMLEQAIEVRTLATPGARIGDVVAQQLPQLGSADLVVVCAGANDVASPRSRRHFATDLDRILTATAPVPTVVLSLPDITLADRLAEPLRSMAGLRSRWFELARARVVAAHDHARSVDIATRPPHISRAVARTMLCADRFHPGPEGYRIWSERIATACHQILTGSPAQPIGRRLTSR